MIALCIVLAVLLLIGITPVGGKVCFDDGDLTAKLVAGPLRIVILPKKPVHGKKLAKQHEKKRLKDLESQKKKIKKKLLKKRAKAAAASGEASAEKKKFTLEELLSMARVGLKVAAAIPRKLYMPELTVRLACGGKDAADAAITFGRICAALGPGLPLLNQLFRIKKQDVTAAVDYDRDSLGVFARVDVRIRIGTAVALALSTGFRFLGVLIQNKIRQKNKLEKAVQGS